MPPPPPDRAADRLHLAIALLTLWLLLSSPWISMLRRIPASAGWLDYAHVWTGMLALVLGVAYGWTSTRGGRWRLYFPWAPSGLRSVGRDLAGLVRGRVPSSEGGGLFGLIEGLLLLILLATGLTGAGWLATQGSGAALAWREYHCVAAYGTIGLLALHVVTVSLHLLDLLRD
jgi:hypothetical protein